MFWGVAVESGKKYSQIVETSYHLSMAALEPSSKKITDSNKWVSLMLEHSKTEFLLCTLEYNRVMQVHLDLMFVEGEEVTFYVNGEGTVHLTGYVLDEDEPESESDASDIENVPITKPKRLSSSLAKPTIDDNEDDSEEDEEGYSPKKLPVANKRKADSPLVSSKKQKGQNAATPQDSNKNGKVKSPISARKPFQEAILVKDIDSDESDDEDFEVDENLAVESDDSGSGDDSIEDEDDSDASNDEEENGGLATSWGKPAGLPQKGNFNVSQNNQKQKSPQSATKPQQAQQGKPNNQSPGNKFNQSAKGNTSVNKGGHTPVSNAVNKTPGSKKKQQQPTPNKDSAEKPEKASAVSPSGIQSIDIVQGKGPVAKAGKMCHVYYTGKLASNNREFDSLTKGKPFCFKLGKGDVIKGWDMGLDGMKVGGKRKIVVPPNFGYGNKSQGPIPKNSTLVFEVELKAVN